MNKIMVIGQDRLGPHRILYFDPKENQGVNGVITCRKINIKGTEYEVIPSHDSKHTIDFESKSDENLIGEIVEYS